MILKCLFEGNCCAISNKTEILFSKIHTNIKKAIANGGKMVYNYLQHIKESCLKRS